ncbi:hypothetical protein [Marispirochaeta aestuarii]|uniref:hypothetical protein n=1 Tax=Marispirochaeta aestuarii TaxID=1963862 RepID=UPI0029C97BB5|nr:hypothetical protein [Marispirochaeta aestuarii]
MRSRQHADEGSITAAALVLLIISTGLTLSTASLAWTQRRQLASFRASTEKTAEMAEIADAVQASLEELDPSEPDWSGSAVYTDIALLESEGSCTVTLEDISSRFFHKLHEHKDDKRNRGPFLPVAGNGGRRLSAGPGGRWFCRGYPRPLR